MYEELTYLHQRLQVDTQSLLNCFAEHNIDMSGGVAPGSFTVDMASAISGNMYAEACKNLPGNALAIAHSKQRALLGTIGVMAKEYQTLHTR